MKLIPISFAIESSQFLGDFLYTILCLNPFTSSLRRIRKSESLTLFIRSLITEISIIDFLFYFLLFVGGINVHLYLVFHHL